MSMGFGLCCCGEYTCEHDSLYLDFENAGLSWTKISTSFSSNSLTHVVQVTCGTDGSTHLLTLPPIPCDQEICKESTDSTVVGACGSIGKFTYGNRNDCILCVRTRNDFDHIGSLGSGLNDWNSSIVGGGGTAPSSFGSDGNFDVSTGFTYDFQKTGHFNTRSDNGLTYETTIDFSNASPTLSSVAGFLTLSAGGNSQEVSLVKLTNGNVSYLGSSASNATIETQNSFSPGASQSFVIEHEIEVIATGLRFYTRIDGALILQTVTTSLACEAEIVLRLGPDVESSLSDGSLN